MSEKEPAKQGGITKWKKGQSGNPKGRVKKDLCLTSLLKDELQTNCLKSVLAVLKTKMPDIPDGISWARVLAIRLLSMAAIGDMDAIREINNRVDGKVPDNIRMAGEGGGPMKTVHLVSEAACAEEWESEVAERMAATARTTIPAS